MGAALGFLSQSQLKLTCFGSLWKSRNGFNNKSGNFLLNLGCTESENRRKENWWKLLCKTWKSNHSTIILKLLAQVSLVCPVTCFLTALIKVNTFRLDARLQLTKNVWKIQLNTCVKVMERALKEGHHQGVKRAIFPLQCKPWGKCTETGERRRPFTSKCVHEAIWHVETRQGAYLHGKSQ